VGTTSSPGGTLELLVDRAEKFSMRGIPLLAEGQDTVPLVATENCWLAYKVYSSGGENSLHSHADEDHAFFVLAGAAVFLDKDGHSITCGPLEGIMIPKNVTYKFQSVPPDNLVLLRVSGSAHDVFSIFDQQARLAPDGSRFDARDPRNLTGAKTPVLSGSYFGLNGHI